MTEKSLETRLEELETRLAFQDDVINTLNEQVARQELELRPGSYTVVGSRKGYRDVRRTLVVEAGREPPVFEIRCEEKV